MQQAPELIPLAAETPLDHTDLSLGPVGSLHVPLEAQHNVVDAAVFQINRTAQAFRL